MTHCFALLFVAERWSGDPQPDGEEATGSRFADPSDPPTPLHQPTAHALGLLIAYAIRIASRFANRDGSYCSVGLPIA